MNKRILIILALAVSYNAQAQRPNWQNLDLQNDGVFGISTEKAYSELLKDKKPKQVIVAIIDGGIDTAQEELKSKLWRDPKTGNHGWNCIGPETGREDIVKLVAKDRQLYDKFTYMEVPEALKSAYTAHAEMMPALEGKIIAMHRFVEELTDVQQTMDKIVKVIGKPDPNLADLEAYHPNNEHEVLVLKKVLRRLHLYTGWQTYKSAEITDLINKANYHLAQGLNGKNIEPETATGNKDITPDKLGPFNETNGTAYHGTHVAGIIAGVRGNGIGMMGVADNVKLMMLKVMGNIREMRDDNLAKAIRFAVDHGAKVINMSLGKLYTWDKKAVDEAVKYAMKNDVLLVHAA